MWRQCTGRTLLIVMLALVQGGLAFGAFRPLEDPALVGWWTCDEGEGSLVADSSPNGNDGAFVNGNPAWVAGVYGNAVELTNRTLVEIPAVNIAMTEATMAGWIKPYGAQPDWAAIIFTRGSATGFNVLANYTLAYHWGDASATWSYRGPGAVVNNEWTFAAVTVAPSQATFYVNGVQTSVNTVAHGSVNWDAPIYLGGDGTSGQAGRRMTGALDDVSLFTRALTSEEIQAIMLGLTDPAAATDPSPAKDATDVPHDASLAWTAGDGATAHDVYLGISLTDVTDASRANPMNVLVAQGQTASTFAPDTLEFGATYYWRIDEVDAGGQIVKGEVWSFAVEPFAYAIANVTATASSARSAMGPENTVNGSGLNAADQHSTEASHMWMSEGSLPNWIQFEFDKTYKLDHLLVWNSNQAIEPFIGFGAKGVTVEYSVDGATWTALEGIPEFGQGDGSATYAANTDVDFGGVVAQYVKLTIDSTFGGLPQTGLSEVRFYAVPVQARQPMPADGATGVSIHTDLSWRPGREAASHEVFIGADSSVVADGSVGGHATTETTYTPGVLDLATTYYWKVDEIGDTGTYAGDVWSFTTEEFFTIEGFESYTDEEGSRVYESWIDGWDDNTNGSIVGHDLAPFAERTIVNSGDQSMPMTYDNTSAATSEAVYTLDSAQNWTTSGAKTLAVHFYGTVGNTGKLYLKIGNAKIAYDGAAADLGMAQWQQWLVDLSGVSGLQSVRTIAIGVEGAGATGTLYIDDIRLYPQEIEYITPVQPDATGLLLKYTFDQGSGSTVTDASGKGNNGTITGTARWVPGFSGTALEFDGAVNYISTGKSLLNNLPAFSIACWLKGDQSMASRSGLIGQNDCVEYGVVSANTVQIWTAGGGSVDLAWPYSTTGEWHHIAAVGDGSGIVFYLDGKPAASGGSVTENYGTSTYTVNIGGGGIFDATGNFFAGQMDEAYVYQRALSPAEVAGLAGRTDPMAKPF